MPATASRVEASAACCAAAWGSAPSATRDQVWVSAQGAATLASQPSIAPLRPSLAAMRA